MESPGLHSTLTYPPLLYLKINAAYACHLPSTYATRVG